MATPYLRLLLGLALVLPFGQASSADEATTTAVAQEILDLDQSWIDAENARDEAAMRRIFAEDFVVTFGTGKPIEREAYIQSVLKRPIDPTLVQNLSDRRVRIAGDTAILVEAENARLVDKGVEFTSFGRMTVTYIRRDGRWQALAEHVASVRPAP